MMGAPQLWLKLFLPFAAGYFLSYLYRTANAVIGPVLAHDLNLGDSALGLLTSTYFLAFGAAQLPLGMWLDRYGPRRVEAALLLLAAAGAALFSVAEGLTGLAVGRALIGLGVSACLMASFKAFSLWFAPGQQASMAGWIMAAGGLGALAAAQPLEWALGWGSWRDIVMALAIATLLIAVLLWWLVPDPDRAHQPENWRAQLLGTRTILLSPHFWRYAPAAFWLAGGFMALQGLWATRWMGTLEGLSRTDIAHRLTWVSASMLLGFLVTGFFAGRLVQRGISLERVYRAVMTLACLTFTLICLKPQFFSQAPAWIATLLWAVLGLCFSLSNMAYSLVSQAYPAQLSGRANTALNLAVFLGAFGLQSGLGALLDLLQTWGFKPDTALRYSFMLLLAGQWLAWLWLLRHKMQNHQEAST